MSRDQENQVANGPDDSKKNEESIPGYCSATCVTKECLKNEAEKALLKTSDLFLTCNLPKRFEHPHWFNGYGCQTQKQHPFYRTTASEYGWYPPGYHTIPTVYFPKNQDFSDKMAQSGMYRIHSVPSSFYPAGQKFTNHLASAGMYRNYSLNTEMDPVPYI